MRKNTTAKALIMSVLALMLCLSMLVGTTFAWFTDSVKSGVNKIVAGNLDIELEYCKDPSAADAEWKTVEGAEDLFGDIALWEPGTTGVVYFRLSNLGTLALKYKLGMTFTDTVIGKNASDEGIKLSEILEFGIVKGQKETFANRQEAMDAVATPKKLNEGFTDAQSLSVTDEKTYFALVVYMPTTTGNEANYRGENIPQIDLGVTLVATQDTVESDSFNNEYDKDIPLTWASTKEELIENLVKGESVLLTDDIASDGHIDFSGDATVDGNGKTLSVTGDVFAIRFTPEQEDTVWTLNNIRVETESNYGVITSPSGADNSTINVNSASLKSKLYGIQTQTAGKTTNLNVDNSVIESWGALVTMTKVNATFNNSHLIGINPFSTPTNEYAVVDISYNGTAYTSEGSVFDFNGCTLEAREDGTETQRFMIVRKGCTITLDECTFIKNSEVIPAERITEDFIYDEKTDTYCNSYIRIYADVIDQVSLMINGVQVNPHYNAAD